MFLGKFLFGLIDRKIAQTCDDSICQNRSFQNEPWRYISRIHFNCWEIFSDFVHNIKHFTIVDMITLGNVNQTYRLPKGATEYSWLFAILCFSDSKHVHQIHHDILKEFKFCQIQIFFVGKHQSRWCSCISWTLSFIFSASWALSFHNKSYSITRLDKIMHKIIRSQFGCLLENLMSSCK